MESGNNVYDSRNNCNAIIETASNTLIAGCKNTIIPNSVTSIGDWAFYFCTSLTSITIPSSVTSIGDWAFASCSNLKTINCNPTAPPTIFSVTFSNQNNIQLKVPEGCKSAYQSAQYWNKFKNIVEIKTIDNLSIVGSFNNWDTENGRIDMTSIADGFMSTLELPTNCEFKLISIDSQGNITWYGGIDETWSGYFLITQNLFGHEIDLIDGSNFRISSGGKFTFIVNCDVSGMKLIVYEGEVFNEASLQVNLPSNATDGRYKDMYVSVASSDGTMHHRCVINDKTSYSFHVSANAVYNVAVTNSSGGVLGEKRDVAVGSEDVIVSFDSLLQPQTVSMAVTLPGGVDITENTGITWTNADGEFVAQGSIVRGMIPGQQLNYEVRLPQEQAMAYVQPDKQSHTVKSQSNSILLTLQPFGTAKIKGSVRDASTGRPVTGATITASQTLNGNQSKSAVTASDGKGQFSLDALTAPASVTASAQGYLSQTMSLDHVVDTTTIEEFILSPITGTTVQTHLTYRPTVPAGQSAKTQDYYDDYQNVSFTLRNATRNKDITRFQVQYPDIVLLEDVAEGDRISVTAHSLKSVFNDVTAMATVTDSCASITLPLVERGALETQYGSGDAASVTGMLYNSRGEQVARSTYRNTALTFNHLPDGNYTLVTMQTADNYNSILTLSGLDTAGLTAGRDYATSNVTVASGVISRVNIDYVPTISTDLLAYTGSNTRFTANKPQLTIGNYVTLTAIVDFKRLYQGNVGNVKLIVDLPEGCDFVNNSLLLGNSSTAYTLDGNHVAVSLPSNGGTIKFCAVPLLAGTLSPSASVQFTYNGKTVTEPIGSATFEVNNLEIRVPSVVSKPEVALSGSCPLNSQISIYDNGELIGNTISQGITWTTSCALPNAYNLSNHEIYAIATTPSGVEMASETATCTYNKTDIEISKVTMYHDNPEVGKLYAIEFDFQNPSKTTQSYTYYIYNKKFTFTIDFSDNDTTLISNVVLHVKTGDLTWTSLPAYYDRTLEKWVTSGEFGNMYDGNIPINVAVSYDCDTQPLLSAETHNAVVNYYKNEQLEFHQEMDKINQVLDAISSELKTEDYDEEHIATQLNEMLGVLGLSVDNDSIGTFTDEEMEGILANCEQVLADSLGLRSDLFLQQSLDEINAITEGVTFGNCDGMTETQLLNEGYQKMEKDDGTCIFIYADETTMNIADLVNDVYYVIDLQSGNPLLAPLVELAQGDSFQSRMEAFAEKIKKYGDLLRSALIKLSDVIEDLHFKLSLRNYKIQAHIRTATEQCKYLFSLPAPRTAEQTLRIRRYQLLLMKYEKEYAFNESLQKLLSKIETKSLRLGKIRIKGLTGTGKLLGKLFVAFDIAMLTIDGYNDIMDAINADAMIDDPCPDNQKEADILRTDVRTMGIGAGIYYTSQLLADIAVLAGITSGVVGAVPSGGTSLSASLISLGVLAASVGANIVWSFTYDKRMSRLVKRIQKLNCYHLPENIPEPNFEWHYPQTPDVKPLIDPSGFVYEAVESNRLEGVTATIYYKKTVEDMYGETHEEEVKWNAEEYAQKNPLFTDENGMYQWDVPQGMWQVRLSKNGYEPAQSEWLPVPPPQLDVNIGMTQLRQPEVEMVHAYKDGVVINFDKYMRPATLNSDNITVTQNGKTIAGSIELLNGEQAGEETFASKIRFVPDAEMTDKPVTLTAKRNVESYAGVQMNNDYTQTFDIERHVRVIAVDSVVNVGYGDSRQLTVQALPADIAGGKMLYVISSAPIIADVDETAVTLDKHGKANLEIYGNLPGAATLTFAVGGFDLSSRTKVLVVDEASLVTAKPVASVRNGKVFGEQVTVELTCATPDAEIYYTINGACPCDAEERIRYTGAITISETTTLKAIAVAPNRYESDIATYYFFKSSSVTDVTTDAPFRITPTVVTDGFSITGITEPCDVRVYNLSGIEVLHRACVHNGETLSLGGALNGMYIVVVTTNGCPWASRILKE